MIYTYTPKDGNVGLRSFARKEVCDDMRSSIRIWTEINGPQKSHSRDASSEVEVTKGSRPTEWENMKKNESASVNDVQVWNRIIG